MVLTGPFSLIEPGEVALQPRVVAMRHQVGRMSVRYFGGYRQPEMPQPFLRPFPAKAFLPLPRPIVAVRPVAQRNKLPTGLGFQDGIEHLFERFPGTFPRGFGPAWTGLPLPSL